MQALLSLHAFFSFQPLPQYVDIKGHEVPLRRNLLATHGEEIARILYRSVTSHSTSTEEKFISIWLTCLIWMWSREAQAAVREAGILSALDRVIARLLPFYQDCDRETSSPSSQMDEAHNGKRGLKELDLCGAVRSVMLFLGSELNLVIRSSKRCRL